MNTLINFCGKYRKWIYGIMSVTIFILFLFPLRKTALGFINLNSQDFGSLTHPFIARAFYWIYTPAYYNDLETVYRSDFWFELFSFIALILFVVALICFWLRELRKKNGIFILPLILAFISHLLLLFSVGLETNETQAHIVFIPNVTFYLFIVLICLYAFAVLFGKLYPRMRPKISETVAKVKTRKTKSQRIEELEKQNAELQKKLDDLSK